MGLCQRLLSCHHKANSKKKLVNLAFYSLKNILSSKFTNSPRNSPISPGEFRGLVNLGEFYGNQSMTSFDKTFNESFGEDFNMEENILPPLTRGGVIIDNEKLLFEEEKVHTVNEINLQGKHQSTKPAGSHKQGGQGGDRESHLNVK